MRKKSMDTRSIQYLIQRLDSLEINVLENRKAILQWTSTDEKKLRRVKSVINEEYVVDENNVMGNGMHGALHSGTPEMTTCFHNDLIYASEIGGHETIYDVIENGKREFSHCYPETNRHLIKQHHKEQAQEKGNEVISQKKRSEKEEISLQKIPLSLKTEIKESNSNRQKISDERQSYAEGLTIHGLNRIVTGRCLNKVVWSILVLASFLIAVFISKQHFDAYFTHQSRTNTKIISEKEIPYPAITFCDYEGLRREKIRFSDGKPIYPKHTFWNSTIYPCGYNLTKCGYNDSALVKASHLTSDYNLLGNKNHFIKFDNTTNCITFSNFTEKTPSNTINIYIAANRTKNSYWTMLYINSELETFQEATQAVYWFIEGYYHVNIRKRINIKLGLPYTDCVAGTGSYTQNKFTGNYTISKCKKGCFWEQVFEKCGAIPQMYRPCAHHIFLKTNHLQMTHLVNPV